MMSVQSLRRGARPLILLVVFLLPSFCYAQEGPPALVVGGSGAHLYAHQDDQSAPIARLEKGEELTPLGHAVDVVPWYLVKTKQGAVGWVKSSDVTVSDRVEGVFKDSATGQLSTWVAVSRAGRTFGGTWTAEPDPATGGVSGTWTLEDDKGKTVLAGTWAANKFDTGWRGVWRASVDGKKDEYAGSWT
ncbi:MAG: SH3 domain-containing protein, partial [Candidatus Binatia bacterium]